MAEGSVSWNDDDWDDYDEDIDLDEWDDVEYLLDEQIESEINESIISRIENEGSIRGSM